MTPYDGNIYEYATAARKFKYEEKQWNVCGDLKARIIVGFQKVLFHFRVETGKPLITCSRIGQSEHRQQTTIKKKKKYIHLCSIFSLVWWKTLLKHWSKMVQILNNLRQKFLIRNAEIKEELFVGSQIRELMLQENFFDYLN